MRILFAADQHPYSAHALQVLAKLAENTWADLTFLGVLDKSMEQAAAPGTVPAHTHPTLEALARYRDAFLTHWPEGNSPYAPTRQQHEWIRLRQGLWEHLQVARGAMKELKIRVRFGPTASEILAAAEEDACSLIVMGCTPGEQCLWQDDPQVPQKVVDGAEVSVLLVKEAVPIRKLFLCLDESDITQDALEMMNQMASITGAELEVVGLTKAGGIKREVFPWLNAVYDYYKGKGVPANIRFSETDDFQQFISSQVTEGLLALWLGKKSPLSRLFKKKTDSIGHFVSTCRTSVMVLR
ncbi:Nucleotide-binding universal stress protein, UspA family [Desulfacinum hydrothermale DSM 13146]|uniref:Nucleotide-binding universal stress protein, UspA family n=1 Tax=Desulfacinum hydrothermale DSM 13146 TaxID=1121390 RepID=A0A1W1WZD7_9BACT|nr:universal stress protein [Desulfacinum hydrothermale]SMC16501.1 Nucleotide-binding universal stress protein, UspA family [Desulfacinum hydrothermale DSM 13146]